MEPKGHVGCRESASSTPTSHQQHRASVSGPRGVRRGSGFRLDTHGSEGPLEDLICEMGWGARSHERRCVGAPGGSAYLLTTCSQVMAALALCSTSGCIYDCFITLMRLIYKAGTDVTEESKH